ncbi:MAG: right-handed parallel beta-helix repeat-containing protein [Actinomycetota bacterium]
MVSTIVATAVGAAPTLHAAEDPFVIVRNQVTSSTDDITMGSNGTRRIAVDAYQGFPLDVEVALRIDHSDVSQLTVELASAAADTHLVATGMDGADLGSGADCDDPTVFDDDAVRSYLDSAPPRNERVAPEPFMDDFLHRDALDGFEVVIRDDRPLIAGTIDCYEVDVTSVVPQGEGTYYVNDTSDTVTFAAGSLTLREAWLLADNDQRPSTIVLEEGANYRLTSCRLDRALVATSPEPLTVVGNRAQISQLCGGGPVLHTAAALDMSHVAIGPSTGYGIIGHNVTMNHTTISGNRGGVWSHGAAIHRSVITGNGSPGLHHSYGGVHANGDLRVSESTIATNYGYAVGGLDAAEALELTNSVVVDNQSYSGSSATEAKSMRAVGSIIARNTSELPQYASILVIDRVELVDSTVLGNDGDTLYAGALIARRSAIFGPDPLSTCTSPDRHESGVDVNVVGDATCAGPNDVIVDDPHVEPDGLPLPRPGSPLIDAIPSDRCTGVVDLAGVVRPQGDGCDAGALELPIADSPPTPVPPPVAAGFEALPPARLVDTRADGVTIDGQHSGTGVVAAGTTIEVATLGRGGIDADATAAFLNVTAVHPEARGFITVYPCGTPRPTASNLNYQPGVTTPNAVLTKIGGNGTVCVYTHATTHLVIDTNGHIHGN